MRFLVLPVGHRRFRLKRPYAPVWRVWGRICGEGRAEIDAHILRIVRGD